MKNKERDDEEKLESNNGVLGNSLVGGLGPGR
jgi:hypothetical protein